MYRWINRYFYLYARKFMQWGEGKISTGYLQTTFYLILLTFFYNQFYV